MAEAAEAAARAASESAGTGEKTPLESLENDAAVTPEPVEAGPVEPDRAAPEPPAPFETTFSESAGIEPSEPPDLASPPPVSHLPGSEAVQSELPLAWPVFPGQLSAEPAGPETTAAPPLRGDLVESAPAQPPSAESPVPPAPSGVAKRLRGVFRRFLAALPASPTEPPSPILEPPIEATAAPSPDVPPGESAPPSEAAEAEVAGPSAAIEVLPAAPDVTLEEVAADPEPVSEPLEEDLPSLDLEDVPTSESDENGEDALPTLELAEEETEEAESRTPTVEAEAVVAEPEIPSALPELESASGEPIAAEPVTDEPAAAEPLAPEAVGTEDLSAEPVVALADAAETEPVTISPEGFLTALDVEAIVVAAAPFAPETEAGAELPEPSTLVEPIPAESELGSGPPAAQGARPARTGELEAFISLSEDVFQDQVTDLIEEMLDPGAEPGVPGPDAPPAPARSLLTGPLFEGLSDDERVALVRGLKLRTFEPGDVVLTEGETGSSLFLLTAGAVRVFVRNPGGSNLLLDDLGEGDFFGEISILSGRPRNATVTAAALCEMLELDQAALAEIALRYPHVSERLQSFSRERAASVQAAALREGGNDPGDPSLESHFDDGRLEPRMRLRLADAFLKAGQEREAAQVLIDLADDLVRRGQNEKAVALLKKVEQLQHRPRGPAHRPASPAPAPGKGPSPHVDDRLGDWLIDVARDTVRRRSAVASRGLDAPVAQALDPRTLRVYRRGLVASPLFEGLSEDELLALVQGLRLRTVEPGDIVLTEGEPGQSVFIVATGQVRVFIRNPTGHDVPLCGLGEGAFFGEISALSGRSRTATVTAAAPSVLLELDQPALEAITRAHPRVQEMLETVYIERATDPSAEAIRSQS